MIVYVSHPIKGRTEQEKHTAEWDAKNWATARGMAALLPRTIPPGCLGRTPCTPDGSAGVGSPHTHACYMRGDLAQLTTNVDAILMMPGWEHSVGCRAELNVALTIGMPIYFYGRD